MMKMTKSESVGILYVSQGQTMWICDLVILGDCKAGYKNDGFWWNPCFCCVFSKKVSVCHENIPIGSRRKSWFLGSRGWIVYVKNAVFQQCVCKALDTEVDEKR